MKLANIQVDILRKDLSRRKDKRIHYAVDQKKGLIFCAPDATVGYFIKCEDFKIDVNKLNNLEYHERIDYFYPAAAIVEPAPKGNTTTILNDKGKDITITKIGNKWVNVKLLAYFDKNATFMSDPNSTTSTIWVYENDELCGLVLPERVPKGGLLIADLILKGDLILKRGGENLCDQ